jgi:hypothetical protein
MRLKKKIRKIEKERDELKKKKNLSLFSIQEHFANSSPSMVVRVKFVIGMGCRNSSDVSKETRMAVLVSI